MLLARSSKRWAIALAVASSGNRNPLPVAASTTESPIEVPPYFLRCSSSDCRMSAQIPDEAHCGPPDGFLVIAPVVRLIAYPPTVTSHDLGNLKDLATLRGALRRDGTALALSPRLISEPFRQMPPTVATRHVQRATFSKLRRYQQRD